MILATASLLLALAADNPPATPRAQMVQLLAARAFAAGACQRHAAASLAPAYPPDFPPKLKGMLEDAYREGKDAPPGPGATPARCTEFLADLNRQIDALAEQMIHSGQPVPPTTPAP